MGTLYGRYRYIYINIIIPFLHPADHGEVYGWGMKTIAGPVRTLYEPNPSLIPNLTDIVGVACGTNNSVALSSIII